MTRLLDLLEDAATGRGTVRFVADDEDPVPIAGLWQDAERVARWFANRVGAHNTVAMVLTNSHACALALLGAWRAGCTIASMPLPGRAMGPQTYLDQLQRFCEAADASVLLFDAAYVGLIDRLPVRVFSYDDTLTGGYARALTDQGALVQYTSGSVNVPKGIELSLEAVGTHIESILAALEIGPGDSSCSWLPLSHDMGLIGMFLAPIVAGAPRYGHHDLTLLTPESFVAAPSKWLRACSSLGATVTVVPNFALKFAIRAARDDDEQLDLSSIRVCIVGSEPIQAQTLERFAQRFAPARFNALSLCPAYGMAEACLAVTMVRPNEPWRCLTNPADRSDHVAPHMVVSVGRPLDGVDVRIAGEFGGEIEFRSASRLTRYIGTDLAITHDGYFPTRDRGFKTGEELFVLGRADDVVVVEGCNIYPEDVENAVEHEVVRAGCVAAVATPMGDLAVIAEPCRAPAEERDLERVCREIRRSVARNVGVAPATVAFVPRGALPKTPSGKLRRSDIRRTLVSDTSFLARVDFR